MKVAIVGCGGFGINQALRTAEKIAQSAEQHDISLVLIDGSDSNLDKTKLDKDIPLWLAPDVDGAGKNRALNVKAYKQFLVSKLPELPPADLYVVPFSTAGGSGSVFGPDLMKYLLDNKQRVIGLTTVTSQSGSDARNSTNVIKGLAHFAESAAKPMVMFLENGDNQTEPEVDESIQAAMEAILYMTLPSLREFDRADLAAFLDYTNHGIKPQLTELVISSDPKSFTPDTGRWLTTLSVIPDNSVEVPKAKELSNFLAVGGKTPLYYATCTNRLGELRKHLETTFSDFEKIKAAHNTESAFDDVDEMEY